MNRALEARVGGVRAAPLVLLAIVLVSGCRAFRPEIPTVGREPGSDEDPVVHLGYLSEGTTVEITGEFRRGEFVARSIEILEADDEVVLKGNLDFLDLDRGRGQVAGIGFEIPGNARLAGLENEDVGLDAFVPGQFVKVELIERRSQLRLRKIRLRERREDELEEIEGPIDEIDFSRQELVIGGVEVSFAVDTPVRWGLETAPGMDPDLARQRVMGERRPGLPRIRSIDEDNRRPTNQFRLGDDITIGGELQYDMEWRDNHDLNDDRDRDRLVQGSQARLEVSFEITDKIYGFVQGRVQRDYVGFDEERDIDFDTRYQLGEAFLYFEDLPLDGLAVQVGRQDFDHGREWVMDILLDATRLYVNLDRALLEVSASMITFGAGDAQEGIKNFLVGLHSEPLEEQELFAYALHRHGGTRTDLERTHLGFSVEGRKRPFRYWGDVGYVIGQEDGETVKGYGVDMIAMYAPSRVKSKPSLYAGYAYGSGDRNPDRGSDRNFRQTGLNDNNANFNGVTSFRYLGELFRPQVSNIQILTAGAGLRPFRRTSVDLLYHHYRQAEAADFLEGSRLRQRPTGESAGLGQEIDLVIGVEDFFPLEVEVVLAYFMPGDAFAVKDDAWFGALQVEWNF